MVCWEVVEEEPDAVVLDVVVWREAIGDMALSPYGVVCRIVVDGAPDAVVVDVCLGIPDELPSVAPVVVCRLVSVEVLNSSDDVVWRAIAEERIGVGDTDVDCEVSVATFGPADGVARRELGGGALETGALETNVEDCRDALDGTPAERGVDDVRDTGGLPDDDVLFNCLEPSADEPEDAAPACIDSSWYCVASEVDADPGVTSEDLEGNVPAREDRFDAEGSEPLLASAPPFDTSSPCPPTEPLLANDELLADTGLPVPVDSALCRVHLPRSFHITGTLGGVQFAPTSAK